MLAALCPSAATLHLSVPVRAAARFLKPWQALNSLQLDGVQLSDVAAVAQLTQLQALHMGSNGGA